MTLRGVQRLLAIAVWLLVAAFALRTVHEFYRYVDSAIYLAVDDSEANISYALATHGRYGFFASPVLVGLPRTEGQFNYGPWYFYLGAALIWLFGYSLTLIRSIHLLVILGVVVAGAFWFRSRDRSASAAVLALGLLYAFAAGQWPMARPDPMVSAFAVFFVTASGAALLRPRADKWLLAGLAAGCGALSHLIAWSLVPVAAAVFAVGAWLQWRDERPRATLVRQLVAVMAGGLAAAFMFYASFGFDVPRQLQFLGAYQDVTASAESFGTVLQRHWHFAFVHLPEALRPVAVVILGLGWLSVAAILRVAHESRARYLAYLLPPLAVWSGYAASLGSFSNFHAGYGILSQVMAWWTCAALIYVGLDALRRWRPMLADMTTIAATAAVLIASILLTTADLGAAREKLLRAREWVPIETYTAAVLDQLPARATAWGTIVYGIENPDRIQLVQLSDALMLTRHMPAAVREPFAPEFLVWGYPENRDSTIATLGRGEDLLEQFASRFPHATYSTVALVAGIPYGVTRIYARVTRGHEETLPAVRVYDVLNRQWRTRLSTPLTATFAAREPAVFHVGYAGDTAPAPATSTVAAELDPGIYFVRISLSAGAGTGPRMIAVTSEAQLTQQISELGPQGGFAAYLARDTSVDVLHTHSGGPLLVSQFDDGAGASIGAIELRAVEPLLTDDEAPPRRTFAAVAPGTWQPASGTGVKLLADDHERVDVVGDASQYGYQLLGPKTSATPGSQVTARVRLAQQDGRVCVGVLNATEQLWLVAPTQLLPEYVFTSDETGGFRLTVANCNAQPSGNQASRFRIEQASVAIVSADLYVDRLIDAGQLYRGVTR